MTAISHREMACSFLELVASGKVQEAYRRYVSPDFRHHNAYFRGDRESLLRGMEENAITHPHKQLEIKKTLEDGDLVMTYSHVRFEPGNAGAAVVHIFRFEEDAIVEMWDLGQAIPPDSSNENGMF